MCVCRGESGCTNLCVCVFRVMWDCVESSESELEDEKNEDLNSSAAVGVDNKDNGQVDFRLKR